MTVLQFCALFMQNNIKQMQNMEKVIIVVILPLYIKAILHWYEQINAR